MYIYSESEHFRTFQHKENIKQHWNKKQRNVGKSEKLEIKLVTKRAHN